MFLPKAVVKFFNGCFYQMLWSNLLRFVFVKAVGKFVIGCFYQEVSPISLINVLTKKVLSDSLIVAVSCLVFLKAVRNFVIRCSHTVLLKAIGKFVISCSRPV